MCSIIGMILTPLMCWSLTIFFCLSFLLLLESTVNARCDYFSIIASIFVELLACLKSICLVWMLSRFSIKLVLEFYGKWIDLKIFMTLKLFILHKNVGAKKILDDDTGEFF